MSGQYQRELFLLVRLGKKDPQIQESGTPNDDGDNGYHKQ